MTMSATLSGKRSRMIVAVMMAVFGLMCVQAVSPRHAEAREPHVCGVTCNGKAPTASVLLQDGRTVVCANSARTVQGPLYPTFQATEGPYTDPYMLVYHVYSTECATTWLSVRNTKAIGRSYCAMWEQRYKAVTHRSNGACPAAGHTSVTPMVDDYMPDSSAAAYGHLEENIAPATHSVTTSVY